ncbi:MAG TPA: ABC transporter ATP-binding protein [Longimicrobiales bacterium]|nr:ABC transporter ATP-binding protein [Longimicrobiales bacterium]
MEVRLLNRESRGFVLYFFRAYPGRTALMVFLLVASGLAEGVGIAALVPVLELGTTEPGREPSGLARSVGETLMGIGIHPTLGVLLSIIVVALWFKGLLRWLAMREVGFVVARVGMDLRLRLIRALMKADWAYFASSPTGYFANSISRDAFRAAQAYREACAGMAGVVSVIVYSIVVLLASWKVALASVFVGGAVLLALRGFVSASRGAGQDQTDVLRSLVARLTEALPSLKPLKAMARERYVLPLLEDEAKGFYRAQQRQVLAAETLTSFQEPLLVVALAIGLFGVMTYTATPFATVLVMTFLFYRLVNAMNVIQQRYASMVTGESAFWSMMNLILASEKAEERRSGTSVAPRLEREVRLEDVAFAYEDKPVLSHVSLEIPSGSFVALVGPSGAGKTTLADLVIGLHRPHTGRVLIDGVDLEEVDAHAWRSMIGYVPQDLLLFHDTILRNVTLGNEEIPRDKVEWALRAAGAWDFVQSRPNGMDWVVGERGGMLSGGQRQRLAIARALVEDPRLLILDEATTALDPETEAAICRSLVGLKGRVTILAISHQSAMREVADQIYLVSDGRVRPLDYEAAV